MASSMSGSYLFQCARQVPDGFWLQRAVHTGWGSGEALSCWVRMVAEARDKNRDTREGRSTASVPPFKSNRNEGKATSFSGSSVRPFPGACLLLSWVCGRSWLLAFCSGSVCGSGPVVCSWPCCVVWFRPPGLFQKRRRPRAPTQRPGFPTLEGDDPRTDLLTGTPFYATWLGAGVMGHRMAVLAYRISLILSRSPSLFPYLPSSSCRFDKNAARVVLHRRCWLSLASTFRSNSVL